MGNFNPEELLSDFRVDLKPACTWKKGDLFGRSKQCEVSGLQFFISKAPRDDYRRQFKEATVFLSDNKAWLQALTKDPRVEEAFLDFGLRQDSELAYYRRLPLNLIQWSGVCGVEIELSFYAILEKSEEISGTTSNPKESGQTDLDDQGISGPITQ